MAAGYGGWAGRGWGGYYPSYASYGGFAGPWYSGYDVGYPVYYDGAATAAYPAATDAAALCDSIATTVCSDAYAATPELVPACVTRVRAEVCLA